MFPARSVPNDALPPRVGDAAPLQCVMREEEAMSLVRAAEKLFERRKGDEPTPVSPPRSAPGGGTGGWARVVVFALVAILLAVAIMRMGSVDPVPTIVTAAVTILVLLGFGGRPGRD